ncbi:MAG: cell division protein FtsA [Oscillospiraceae bacterium]
MEEKKQRTRTTAAGQKAAEKPAKTANSVKSSGTSAPAKKPRRTKKQQGDIVFALDIGTRTVVGVLAEKTAAGYKVIDMETVAHESRSMTDGQIEDIDAVSAVVKSVKSALERRQSIKLQRACVAAAGRALKTLRHSSEYDVSDKRSISAEDISAAEMEAVRAAEEQFTGDNGTSSFYCVGHSVIALELDGYKVAKPEGHRGNTLKTEVIAAFLPAYVVESLCAVVDNAGLETAGLTLEPIAAINAVVPPELRLINVVMCDIGAGTSDIAVSRDGSIVAYGMATVAGDEITEALMKKLLVDFNTAEQIKTSHQPQSEYTDILLTRHTVTAEEVAEILRPAAENLAQTICAEIISANGEAPQAVFLVGGGSKLGGLPELVAGGLGLDRARVAVGSREMIRGVTAPKSIEIGTEHATPLGIAMTATNGLKYDFTTITLNGKKIRALDTRRLTVFELCNLAGIKPEQLMARSGKSLAFTVDGERVLLRGTPSVPAEMLLNGRECSLSSSVRKGDEVNITPAIPGEDAAALLSDYFSMDGLRTIEVSVDGRTLIAGDHLLVNGRVVCADGDIENGDVIQHIQRETLGGLLSSEGLSGDFLLNGSAADMSAQLSDGDVIVSAEPPQTVADEEAPAAQTGIPIVFNGEAAMFPAEPGRQPIFLDILAAFTDDPTGLLAHSDTVTINGKTARLNEVIHSGDVIVIE